MEKFDLCNDLQKVITTDELDSNTLKYRINNFIYACNIDLEEGKYIHIINDKSRHFCIKESVDDKYRLSINIMDYLFSRESREFRLAGRNGNLFFEFINRYNDNVLRNKVMEIPFSIELDINRGEYVLKTATVEGERVEFNLKKRIENGYEHLRFFANILDFSNILQLVKSFVEDPKLVYDKYDEVIAEKKIVLTNTEVKKGMGSDESLEKPMNKILKKILNNNWLL